MLTPRAAGFLGCTALGGLVGLVVPELWTLVLWIDGVLATLFVVDWVRAGDPRTLELSRALPERVALGAELERRIRLTLSGARGRRVELREEFPMTCEVIARSVRGESAPPLIGDPTGGPDVASVREPRVELALTRRYRARVRGEQTFGRVRLRVFGPLGLVVRQATLGGAQTVAVEPALPGLARTLRLAASRRWQDLGVRSLRRRGGPTEFESLREYTAGDDVRRVDWKAFARRGRPVVRQYQVERGQELLLLVESGRRMGAIVEMGRVQGASRLDHALDAALELAAVALREGDRVGLAIFDDRLRVWIPPDKGRAQFRRLMRGAARELPSERETDWRRMLAQVALRHRRRATWVVLGEVADPLSLGEQRSALARAAKLASVIFTALDDPAVREVARGARPPSPIESALRGAAQIDLEARLRALSELAHGGVRVLAPAPAEAAGQLLSAWLEERRAFEEAPG